MALPWPTSCLPLTQQCSMVRILCQLCLLSSENRHLSPAAYGKTGRVLTHLGIAASAQLDCIWISLLCIHVALALLTPRYAAAAQSSLIVCEPVMLILRSSAECLHAGSKDGNTSGAAPHVRHRQSNIIPAVQQNGVQAEAAP